MISVDIAALSNRWTRLSKYHEYDGKSNKINRSPYKSARNIMKMLGNPIEDHKVHLKSLLMIGIQ